MLGARLNLDDEEAKGQAIRFLGGLFADYFSRNRSTLMPEMLSLVWNNWLSRRHDKSADVRLAWTSTIGAMLQRTPSMMLLSEISTGLNERLLDPEGKVREGAVIVLSRLCDTMILPDPLLIEIVNRARDEERSGEDKGTGGPQKDCHCHFEKCALAGAQKAILPSHQRSRLSPLHQ